MHLYAFGSLCRGEIDELSDVDILAIVDGYDARFDRHTYSIYSYAKMKQLWSVGNPFAWHLHLESKLVYSSDGIDFLGSLGSPKPYRQGRQDCEKFFTVFKEAFEELQESKSIAAFLLSSMFLGYRNFATCYSLQVDNTPTFSRRSAFLISESIPIPKDSHNIFERCRILCTRAIGDMPSGEDIDTALKVAPAIMHWMERLKEELPDG